jgi:acetyl esterase/lipase
VLAADHEGRQVAEWLNSFGVSAFVLQYRLAPRYGHPAPLQDARRAIRTLRASAAEWGLDPTRIGILGFSAGGHLAATAGTQFEEGRPDAADAVERVSSRPDFMILVYPVISLVEPFTHRGSSESLLGQDADSALLRSMSADQRVTTATPPSFLVHTTEDRGVPPENSLAFFAALRRAGVQAELHVFAKGDHGLGLGPAGSGLAAWPALCETWMDALGFAPKR